MTVAVSSDLYSKSVEVINDSLYDLGISVDDKKTKVNNPMMLIFLFKLDFTTEKVPLPMV